MRLNLTRLRTSGAARRSALRAPSALRAAARRNMLPNMKIEPFFSGAAPRDPRAPRRAQKRNPLFCALLALTSLAVHTLRAELASEVYVCHL